MDINVQNVAIVEYRNHATEGFERARRVESK